MKTNSLFDVSKNYIRFEILLNAPFPTIAPPIIFTKMPPKEMPVSYRLTSQAIREGSSLDFSPQIKGVLSMYPSLPSTVFNYLTMDIAIISEDINNFSKLFGESFWHGSHLYWQDIVFTEINSIIDLARVNAAPQYMIRNVSTLDMRSARVIAIEGEQERILTNYLLPQVAGKIDISLDAMRQGLKVPFYFINYLDARRHCVECRYREMQISACNAIEAGSWHVWEMVQGVLEVQPIAKNQWNSRYGAVAKALSKDLGKNIKQPKTERETVWKHRQKAMHGENIIMGFSEAQEIITALSSCMDYVEQVSEVLREHKRSSPS